MLANGLHNDERCLQSDADLAAQDVACDQLFSGILNFWLLVTTATRTQCLPLNLSPLLSSLSSSSSPTHPLFSPLFKFFFPSESAQSFTLRFCPSYSLPSHLLLLSPTLRASRWGWEAGGGTGSWTEMEGKVADKQGESVSESDTK